MENRLYVGVVYSTCSECKNVNKRHYTQTAHIGIQILAVPMWLVATWTFALDKQRYVLSYVLK